MTSERTNITELINESIQSGATQKEACKILGLTPRTLQRWEQSTHQIDGRLNPTHTPKNKLNELEYQRVLSIANEPEYADLPPCKIVPKLADKGRYIASESTFYRVLNAEKQLAHRGKEKSHKPANKKPKALTATAPNQVYTWDISYLPTQVRGIFLYLYLVLDIYSRKIVGWQIYDTESSARAADLMTDICLKEKVKKEQVTLHSDNGSPMKGATLLATLQELGIMPSFSRPSVSNDNPYSESLFRTLKYRPEYPEKPFENLLFARQWMEGFCDWYNHEHLHSTIKFVTPVQRHNGKDTAILKARNKVYQLAKKANPERWSGKTRNWDKIDAVYLNPEKTECTNEQKEAA